MIQVGVEDVRFYGSSFIIAPDGTIIAQASRDASEVIVADIDPARIAHWRRLFPLLKQRRPEVYGDILHSAKSL